MSCVLLGPTWYLDFLYVVGFPISLSLRTIQHLGSVQNLDISLSSWFSHRFDSENHAIPLLCPKLRYFFKFGGISPSAKVWDVELTLEAPRTIRATDASKRSP